MENSSGCASVIRLLGLHRIVPAAGILVVIPAVLLVTEIMLEGIAAVVGPAAAHEPAVCGCRLAASPTVLAAIASPPSSWP